MIQALIVDDEYFVRRGLQHMIPWQEYEITIVGEASNGESALKIMENEQVDLLITDLSMPIMTGFELISHVREKHPDTHIVVLTCHQDFHHAREAVRYGVLDYIVKTELEDESLNLTIRKVVDRIRQSGGRLASVSTMGKPHGVLYVPVLQNVDHARAVDKLADELAAGERPLSLAHSGLFVRSGQFRHNGQTYDHGISRLGANEWIPVIIRNLPEMPEKTIKNVLEQYMERSLYFEYAFDKTEIETDWNAIQNEIKQWSAATAAGLEEICGHWKQFVWIYDGAAFDLLIKFVRERRPLVSELTAMIQETLSVWRYFAHIADSPEWVRQQEGYRFWEQWIGWLREIRPRFKHPELSDEVSLTVVKAGQLMLDGMKDGLGQAEIARQVNINRSYFSHCFKLFVGRAFHDVMNTLRVDKAVQLLEQTSVPIYMIADQVGFKDDKYFSKFFKQQTGKLPRDIRSQD